MPTRTALRDPFTAQLSDDELVEQARRLGNDDGAFEELYRRHENAARNVARHILRSRQDADDVVNEAFAGVISAITNGAGPRTNFRQYLMACVRNSCKSRRWNGNSITTDPSIMEQNGVCFEDPDRLSEQGLVASAFSSLSPDWQLTLWLTAVEERPTSEVAEQLGRRPGAVAALAHRAREAFAEAYLAQHQARNSAPACAKISPKLAHYVRGNSGDVDTVLVERHLSTCVPCSCAVDELRDLNASLRSLTGPAPLLGAGLTAASAGAAMVAGFVPLMTAGGWSIGALGGATLAKAAVIGALLVPAAAIVSSDQSSAPSARAVAASAEAATVRTVAGTSSGEPTADRPDSAAPASGDAGDGGPNVVSDPAASSNAQPTGSGGPSTPTSAGSALPLDTTAGGHPLGDVATVATVPVATVVGAVTAASVPPVSVKVPLPGGATIGVDATIAGSNATVAATVPVLNGAVGVDLNAGVTGVNLGVSVTVPVVTLPLSVGVTIPPGVATPAISIGGITAPPVTTPVIATPAVTLPGGTPVLPAVVIPSVPVLPPLAVPPVTVPSIDLTPVVSTVVTPILQVLLGNH